ncbi:Transducin (beta)-like 1 X-linked receptor 1 [Phytophthora boehmeriae]|uniref:Transducin (Beta)-like 1 X-linked receptor 1 n=1 Tax=Phytophthora boehmeriae TaxID=109152 RepID=A0A8T1WPP7_9STRA|nr:Transducin (beta)-like 1 X-linked receptor 1 [Phytophthora boehmeriae]
MISFDTFSGPRRVREAELDAGGLLTLAEQPCAPPELFPTADCGSSDDDDAFYESQEEDEEDCDLFHEKDEKDATLEADAGQGQASGGRIRQLVELLTLQSRNVEDARSALVDKLLHVVNVHELLLSRATEDQIANAANDAITEEILASVDEEEERRRQQKQLESCISAPTEVARRFDPGQLSPFRVLELVDVLDSTTGGMVKRVLTKVRRRAPLNARMHRSDECPKRGSSSTVLLYSVDAASKVRDRVLETIPQVLPPPAVSLVWRSLDKVGDADLILRKTLHRIGVWGGGSQTPITTPYAPPSTGSSDPLSRRTLEQDGDMCLRFPQQIQSPAQEATAAASSPSSSSSAPVILDGGLAGGVYVLSYAEGHSVVPARILKYMRLLMHHEVSTNAFSVVVRFDPRPSHWELQRPGMVSPRSLPSSPTLNLQVRKRMANYTLQTLLGARDKLHQLVTARRKLNQRPSQKQQPKANGR